MAKKQSVGGSEVRAWLREQGEQVGSRGRLSAEQIGAFEKATGKRYEVGHVATRRITGVRVTDSGRKVPVTVNASIGEVRAWAQSAGLDVGSRGRIAPTVLSAFAARPKV